MNKFKPFFLVVLMLFSGILFVSAQLKPGKHFPVVKKGYENLVDTRIDNMVYWINMAKKGYVEVAPEVPVPPAIFSSSKINARSVIVEDSPDVPVTELNSTQSENSIFANPSDNTNSLNSNNSSPNPVSYFYGANDFYTFDGGASWGGELEGAGGGNSGDPAACISLDNRWYVGYIHNNGGQGVSYSTDQGQTWTPVQVDGGGAYQDKNHLWVDNCSSSPYQGYLYDTWTDLAGGPDYSDVVLRRSINGGVTWSSRINISSAVSAGSHDQGANVHSGPDGEVYVIWAVYDGWPTDETALGFARSFDGGATFQPGTRILENIRGIRTSETSKNQRVNSFPSMTVDISDGPNKGTIYAVWPNIGVPGVNTGPDIDVYMIKSTDQGATWSTPSKVNQDPSGLGKQHYFPWITCDPAFGTLSVVFYDDRNVTSTQCEVYCANSSDGGETWEDFKVSDVAFTPSPIPGLAGGYMGDYLGISAQNRVVYPCWTDTRLGYAMSFVSPYVTGPPPNQPWVIYDSYQIDDSQGNGNGEMDFGEDILLNLAMKNIGDTPALQVHVTITSNSPYITFNDNTQNYGDFSVDEVKSINGAFGFTVSDSIINGTKVKFFLTAIDAHDSTFLSNFEITAHAPALAVGNITVSDPSGNNNGRLDPGETADILIATSNPGSFDANNVVATLSCNNPFVTLNSNSFTLNTLTPGQTENATFSITVDAGAPTGTAVNLYYLASSDYHVVEKTFVEKIGMILEDFETGDFSQFGWTFGGNAAWTITSDDVYEGIYCARSGQIGDNSNSIMMLVYNVGSDDSISFYRRVSSEDGYDFLTFYIDDVIQNQWSGEAAWERVAYAVTTGMHTFKWTYSKDVYVTGGMDRAWVDYISFPPELRTTAYAGPNGVTCQTDSYQLQGNATLYETIEWTTSGTGTFDDNTILNPFYTPSSDDIANGTVELTLIAHGPTENTSDAMMLTIVALPVAIAGPSAAVCDYETFTLSAAEAQNYTELLWTTSGDGAFDVPTILNPVYTPGPQDIATGTVTLTLKAVNLPCAESVNDMILTINQTPVPEISGLQSVCPNIETTYITPELTGYNYEWAVTGGTITSGQNTSQITVSWDPAGNGSVTVTQTNTATLCYKTATTEVIVNPDPVPSVTGSDVECKGATDVAYSTSPVEGDSYGWTVTGGAITSGQETNEIMVTWDTPGIGNVSVLETILSTGCQASSSRDVTVIPLPVVNLGNDTSICHNHILALNAGNPDAQSWVWSTGETTQTITIDSTGAGIGGTKVITVTVTSVDGCVSTDEISVYFEDCSGISENAYDLGVNIFPNPNKGTFTLELDPAQNDVISIRIVSASGVTMLEENNIELTGKMRKEFKLDSNGDGIYYLYIESNKVHSVKKVVVQR
jgi:hypothetical protein